MRHLHSCLKNMNELFIKHGEYMNNNIRMINGGEPFSSSDVYLTSTENRSYPNDMADIYNFSNKVWLSISKNDAARIRAIKEF